MAGSVSGQRSRSIGPGACTLSRHGMSGVAEPLSLPRSRDARPDRGTGLRRANVGSSASRRSCSRTGSTKRVMSMRSAIGPEILRAVLASLDLPAACTGGRASRGGTPRTGTGCRRTRTSCGPGRSRPPRRARSRSPPTRAARAAPRRRRSGTAGTRRGTARRGGPCSPPRAAPARCRRRGCRCARRSGAAPGTSGRRRREAPAGQGAGERVHRGQLERLVVGEVGQQAGDAFGEGGLARALRARSASGGGRRPPRPRRRSARRPSRRRRPCRGPPAAPPRARRAAASPTSAPPRGASGTSSPCQQRDHLAQRPDPEDPHAGHHRRLGGLRLGHVDGLDPAGSGGHRHRQHARDAAHPAVEGQLADHRRADAACRAGTSGPAAARTATAMPRSKCGPRLGRSAGESSTVMRRVLGQVQVAVDDRGAAPVAGLADRGVGPADQRGPEQPVGEVDLDVDDVPDGSLEGDGVGGGDHQPTPRTCSTSAGPAPATSTPTRSIRMPPGLRVVLLDPAHRQPPQALGLGRG